MATRKTVTSTALSRPRATEPTETQKAQARAFAEWQKAARVLKEWGMPDLARAVKFSDSQVRNFDLDARAGFVDGKYRRPGEDYIRQVAQKTGASEMAGLIAAGWILLEKDRVIMAGLTYTIIDGQNRPAERLIQEEDVDLLLFRNNREQERK